VLYFFILHIIGVAMYTDLKRIFKVAPVHKKKHTSYELDVKIDIINPFQSGVEIYSTLLPHQFWTNVELCSHVFVSQFSVHISIILPSLAVYAIPTYS
jgi:hypothetical protein